MASAQAQLIAREVRTLFRLGSVASLTDEALLARFADGGDEAAFEALVDRHGPMVLRVCRDVLGDSHEAQDAFQATFLVLLRRAGSIRRKASLAPWLHGVARRVSARAVARAARRRDCERRAIESGRGEAIEPDPASDLDRAALHAEIDRLPAIYRAPVVLCYLEGLTHDQAALRLGWPVGTVRGRLARARDRLRDRLRRRGLSPAVGPWLPPGALPPSLIRIVMTAKASPGVVPAAVAALTEGALRTMFWHKSWMLALNAVAIGSLAAGGLLMAQPGGAGDEGSPAPAESPRAPVPTPKLLTGSPVPSFRPSLEQISPSLEEALNQSISLPAMDRLPLGGVVRFLSEASGVNLVLDRAALAEVGVTPETPISLPAVNNVKLKSVLNALKFMLKPLQLTCFASGDVLLITSLAPMVTRTYAVADLVVPAAGSPSGPDRSDFAPLIDLIKDSVAPGSWGEDGTSGAVESPDGSKGSITPFFLNTSLIIRQTTEVHDQIVQRLRQLRRLRGLRDPEEDRQRIGPPDSEHEVATIEGVSHRLDDQGRQLREMERKLDRLIEAVERANGTTGE